MKTVRGQRPNYKIVQVLGEGLTGKVFKALRSDSNYGTHQVVAIKLLKSKNQVSVLRNEFARLKKIESNHCVKLLGWENLEMGPALILEHLDGLNLWDLIRYRRVGRSLVQEIVAQSQQGLRDLKDQGIFHGDLSLKNIYVTTRGQVKLIDFGCGLAGEAVLGNPIFMAPELKKTLQPNAQSDLFALGMIEQSLLHADAIPLCPESHFDQSDLLRKDPQARRFQSYRSRLKMRQALGKEVRLAIDEKSQLQNTKILNQSGRYFGSVATKTCLAGVSFLFFGLLPWNSMEPLARAQVERSIGMTSPESEKTSDFGNSNIYIDSRRPGAYRYSWPAELGGGQPRILFVGNETLKIIGRRP